MTGEEFFVTGGPLTSANLAARGVEEVLRNIRVILATVRGELFLDRDFGIPGDMVDEPQSKFSRHLSAIAAEVERQEPRCQVVRIELRNPGGAGAADGRTVPCVRVRIREGMLI